MTVLWGCVCLRAWSQPPTSKPLVPRDWLIGDSIYLCHISSFSSSPGSLLCPKVWGTLPALSCMDRTSHAVRWTSPGITWLNLPNPLLSLPTLCPGGTGGVHPPQGQRRARVCASSGSHHHRHQAASRASARAPPTGGGGGVATVTQVFVAHSNKPVGSSEEGPSAMQCPGGSCGPLRITGETSQVSACIKGHSCLGGPAGCGLGWRGLGVETAQLAEWALAPGHGGGGGKLSRSASMFKCHRHQRFSRSKHHITVFALSRG